MQQELGVAIQERAKRTGTRVILKPFLGLRLGYSDSYMNIGM